MKLLLDNGTPAPLRRYLGDHEIRTAAQLGWATLANGDLLDRAEDAGYEVLITTDQSIRFQQNLAGRGIGIVVLMEARWPYVRLRTAAIREAIKAVQPGEAREVPIPRQAPAE